MIQFFTHWMPLLDAAAKIAAIFGVIGLGFAYCQYRHSVRIAERNERRAAVELAARECARYGSVLMKQLVELNQKIKQSDCKYLEHYKIIKEGEQLKFDATAVTAEDKQRIEVYMPEIMCVLNSLEGFAIPFATGVADDDVGFMECGRSFVTIIENNLGLYSFSDLNHYYLSSQKIYVRWKKRINDQKIERHHLEIGKQFFVLTAERLEKENPKSRIALTLAKILRKVADKISTSKS
jgi:hypothetical protein